jgi:hypothetical protein
LIIRNINWSWRRYYIRVSSCLNWLNCSRRQNGSWLSYWGCENLRSLKVILNIWSCSWNCWLRCESWYIVSPWIKIDCWEIWWLWIRIWRWINWNRCIVWSHCYSNFRWLRCCFCWCNNWKTSITSIWSLSKSIS